MGFLGIIGLCYLVELFIVKPDWAAAAPAVVIPRKTGVDVHIKTRGGEPDDEILKEIDTGDYDLVAMATTATLSSATFCSAASPVP